MRVTVTPLVLEALVEAKLLTPPDDPEPVLNLTGYMPIMFLISRTTLIHPAFSSASSERARSIAAK